MTAAAPELGALPDAGGGTRFRVWAPAAARVAVVIEPERRRVALAAEAGGYFAGRVGGVGAGDRYRIVVDDGEPVPDPASRAQPDGVHGASAVVDPGGFPWSDAGWRGVALADLVLYELHVGTFTSAGTFAAAAARLPELRDLGVTAIELMPVADFPGDRNWGYDGAALFAPARCYGTPDDLRRLVDAAHRLGLAVHLDVVYNHFGPDGAYAAAVSPAFFSDRHRSPWGAGINLDGAESAGARAFFVANAVYWIREYHVDGLRLDATHALVDDGPRHFVAEVAAAARAAAPERRVLVIAEDARNLARMVRSEPEGGWGLDAVWADDFHHQIRRRLAGDRDGYYADYSGSAADLATTLARGWFFTGQWSAFAGTPRGTDPAGIDPARFVFCLQNHDQVGNRAAGERLHHQVDLAAYRAASALLLLAPETPLLFMGQEWAARSPFLFFTDHRGALGRAVTDGRRREFARFASFASPEAAARIPDPQAPATFASSRLDWDERAASPHAETLRFYRALLALRRTHPALARGGSFAVDAVDADTILLRRAAADGAVVLAVVRLAGSGEVAVAAAAGFTLRLHSEDERFAPDPAPPRIRAGTPTRIRFARPGAVVLEGRRP